MANDSDAHEIAHELRDVVSSTVDAYLAYQRELGASVGVATVLLALEMQASLVRRWCRDGGVTKDEIRQIQMAASDCAKDIYASPEAGVPISVEFMAVKSGIEN